jgi:hypothetical protein
LLTLIVNRKYNSILRGAGQGAKESIAFKNIKKDGGNMKAARILAFFFSAFALLAIFSPAPATCSNVGFSLKLYGGLNYLSGGDLNEGLKGMNDYYARYFWFFGLTKTGGDYQPVHLGLNLGGDFIVQITPALGIGLGAGHLQGTSESTVTFGPVAADVKTTPQASAVPVRLGLYVTLPASAFLNVNFHAGLGYYFAKMSYDFRTSAAGTWNLYAAKADSSGLGFHGGIGFEFKLSPAFSLIFEGQGRYASIGGFKGSFETTDSSGGHSLENGKLYYYRYTSLPLGTFPVILVSDTMPSGTSTSDVRTANIDFSGFSAVAGMIIHF